MIIKILLLIKRRYFIKRRSALITKYNNITINIKFSCQNIISPINILLN